MLSHEDNELMCRVGPGNPHGVGAASVIGFRAADFGLAEPGVPTQRPTPWGFPGPTRHISSLSS